eukprot:3245485-Rhodomonas_salina.2
MYRFWDGPSTPCQERSQRHQTRNMLKELTLLAKIMRTLWSLAFDLGALALTISAMDDQTWDV